MTWKFGRRRNAGAGVSEADTAPFHTRQVDQVLADLGADPERGLSEAEASSRLSRDGPNDLQGGSGPSAIKIFLSNFLNAMNLVLIAALILSAVLKDWIEAIVLAIIIITNTGVGFYQEFRSEKTMEALRKLSSPTARVIREGQVQEISASNVVVGDTIMLTEGDLLPADLRIVEQVHLEIDEALLTGETKAVKKVTNPIEDPICPLGDRKNLAFKNTIVTKGRGVGIVIKTGMKTEIGKIAESVQSDDGNGRTHLQTQMFYMAIILFVTAILFALVVFAVNSFSFEYEIVLYAIAVAIALLPEALPAIVTVIMALAVRDMAKQKAVVRRLNAIEALGEVTNICSDKTGTLTVGKMTLTSVWIPWQDYKVTGEGLTPEGKVLPLPLATDASGPSATLAPEEHAQVTRDNAPEPLYYLALCASLCSTSSIQIKDGAWTSSGDSTEVALLFFAAKLGMARELMVQEWAFEAEMPFDASLKKMTVVYRAMKGQQRCYLLKGAIEPVYAACANYQDREGALHPLTEEFRQEIAREMETLARQGLRVLALAYRTEEVAEGEPSKTFHLDDRASIDTGMTFAGLVGMQDPPRAETADAVRQCHLAGITVHMATGDHPHTASAIAKQIGIIGPEEQPGLVMEAKRFDALSDEQIDAMPELPRVLARCSPESKVRLVKALHRRKRIVAMTGDGVNDAPSVKKADIGISMGEGGSDVTKQASDIMLTNDDFSTIVKAVAAGRRIFVNICKFTLHLLTSNVAEVLALVVGLAFFDADGRSIFPMSPLQILWLNLITTTPPSLLLGVEKGSKDLMLRPPRSKKEGLFSKELLADTFFYGFVMGSLTLLAFVTVVLIDGTFETSGCNRNYNGEGCPPIFRARGTSFATLYLLLLLHAFNCRHPRKSLFRMKYRNNLKLVFAVLVCVAICPPILYIPYLNTEILRHAPISWEWGLVAAAIVLFFAASELYKALKRACLPKYRGAEVSEMNYLKQANVASKEVVPPIPKEPSIVV